MKKIYLLLLVIGVAFGSCKKDSNDDPKNKDPEKDPIAGCMDEMAQNYNAEATEDDGNCEYLAATTSEKRKVVLEDFTGVKCQWCPDGHRRALELQASYPDDVILLAVHAKAYGTPYGSDPNLVTSYADALVLQSRVAGYPAGTVNRYQFNASKGAAPYFAQNDNGLALSRGGWKPAGQYVLDLSSPVNVAVKSEYDEASKTATITTELYYTESVGSTNKLNVAITESGIMTKQAEAGKGIVDYQQDNVLRELVTGQWGEDISETEAGTRIQRTHTYTVQSEQVLENLEVVVFVAEGQENIYTGARTSLK
ncbi:MAG: Omp28-related outer membrane protein [Bacteroidia bacterium]